MTNNPFQEINEKLDFLSELLVNSSSLRVKEQKNSGTSEILNIEEASRLIKMPIPTIRHHMKYNLLPYKKPGKRVLFDKVELLRWLDKFSLGSIEKEKEDRFKTQFSLK